MIDERRRHSRTRSGGVVRYESATGKEVVSRWLDLGSGGLFVEADLPTAVGTLLTLEIEIPGERAPASATGRVTWVREEPSTDGKPPGMGVTFIDVDDTVLASIGRFVAGEASSEAQAQPRNAVVSREQTVLGVGLSALTPAGEQTPAAAPSPRVFVPSREKTVVGVAPVTISAGRGQLPQLDRERSLHNADDLPAWPDAPPEPAVTAAEISLALDLISGNEAGESQVAAPVAEKSLPIDLAVPKPAPAAPQVHQASAAAEQHIPVGEPSSASGEFREASGSSPRRRSRGGVSAFVFLLLVLTMAGGGYVYRARLWPWIAPWIARIGAFRTASVPAAATPMGTPGVPSLASASPIESGPVIVPAASASATPNVDADAGARAQVAPLDAIADAGDAKAPIHRPAAQAQKHHPAAARQAGADDER